MGWLGSYDLENEEQLSIQCINSQVTTSPDTTSLQIEKIRYNLRELAVGHTIYYYPTVPSTMPIAHSLAEDRSIRSGTFVIAEEQTAGRGRLSRTWHSPFGKSILLSILLRPEQLPTQPATLMMIAGSAAVEAILQVAPTLAGQCGLKWPNDILLGKSSASPQKVGGILIESRTKGDKIDHIVIGLGINVNQSIEQLAPSQPNTIPSTSIRAYTGSDFDRAELLIAIGRLWESNLQHALVDEGSCLQKWRELLWTIGQQVDILDEGKIVHTGVAIDVNLDGALLIRTEDGNIHPIHVGDVSLRAKNR